MATVPTRCQSCGAEFQTEYRRLGAPVECGECLEDTVPRIPDGTPLPQTGWEMSYQDFRQLVGYASYRKAVAPLLKDWFGYRLAGEGRDTLILNRKDEAIDLLWLHLAIQDDADRQHALYRTAMSLWR